MHSTVVIGQNGSQAGKLSFWNSLRMRLTAALLLSGLLMSCSSGGAGHSNSTDGYKLPGAPAQRANPP